MVTCSDVQRSSPCRSSNGVCVQELQSAAVEGLVRATKLFDPSKGFKFSTYAHWWIRQAITKAMSLQSRVMYVPQNVYELAVQVNQLQAELSAEYGAACNVPDDVLAAGVGISVKRLRDVRLAMRDPVSLNAPLKADGDSSIQDTIQVCNSARCRARRPGACVPCMRLVAAVVTCAG
jgi:RNA polymerase primary sigma factor